MSSNNNKKSNALDRLKNLSIESQKKEYVSSFDFETFEIKDENLKNKLVKAEEVLQMNFKKNRDSLEQVCEILKDVKQDLKEKDSSFMAWYTYQGFTKDKVSVCLKRSKLYEEFPEHKDKIFGFSDSAIKYLTQKKMRLEDAGAVLELGIEKVSDIEELIEVSSSIAQIENAPKDDSVVIPEDQTSLFENKKEDDYPGDEKDNEIDEDNSEDFSGAEKDEDAEIMERMKEDDTEESKDKITTEEAIKSDNSIDEAVVVNVNSDIENVIKILGKTCRTCNKVYDCLYEGVDISPFHEMICWEKLIKIGE